MNILGLPPWLESKFIPEPNSGCWLWLVCLSKAGYGQLRDRESKKTIYAHRFVYELLVRPIPQGLHIDHLCRTRCCVNPGHLEPVTSGENVRRGVVGQINGARQRAKTHCPSGHLYDVINTGIRVTSDGLESRRCRKCAREYAARKYAATRR